MWWRCWWPYCYFCYLLRAFIPTPAPTNYSYFDSWTMTTYVFMSSAAHGPAKLGPCLCSCCWTSACSWTCLWPGQHGCGEVRTWRCGLGRTQVLRAWRLRRFCMRNTAERARTLKGNRPQHSTVILHNMHTQSLTWGILGVQLKPQSVSSTII